MSLLRLDGKRQSSIWLVLSSLPFFCACSDEASCQMELLYGEAHKVRNKEYSLRPMLSNNHVNELKSGSFPSQAFC